MGLAEITHPFHPLRGQRFAVLKVRRVSGVAMLSLRHTELGSFAVPQEWTDRATPTAELGEHALIVDIFALSELAAIVDFATRDSTKD